MLATSKSPENSTTVRTETNPPGQRAKRLARAALQTAFLISDELGLGLAERLFTTPRRHPRPERERAILATATRFEVDVVLGSPRWGGRATSVAAWRWGVGPAVVLVHGWEGRGSQLGAFVEPLVAAGLSVVTFDAPAHGDSPGHRMYLTDHADAVAAVVRATPTVHAVIAHSFGAAAVLLAHARHGIDVARNVMIAPNVLIEDSVDKFARTVALDASDRARFEQQIARSSGVAIATLGLDRLAGPRETALLVVHDRGDREVAVEHGLRLAAAWPQAHLALTDDLGHRRILRDGAVVDRAVAFIREGLPAPASDLVREVDRLLARFH